MGLSAGSTLEVILGAESCLGCWCGALNLVRALKSDSASALQCGTSLPHLSEPHSPNVYMQTIPGLYRTVVGASVRYC